MKNKEIVIDARMINSSGIGTYLKNILPKLSKEFKLILLGNSNELNKFSWIHNCEIIEFNSGIYSLKQHVDYYNKVPKTTLLWCPHINSPFLKTRAKNIITTIHDTNHLALKHNYNYFKRLYAKAMYNNSVKKSAKILTVSNFSKSEILKYTKVDNEKVRVIYCGVDTTFFSNNESVSAIDIPENYILFVGNIKPHKNLITLLKAYDKLSKKIKESYKLIILGKKEGFITADKEVFNFVNKKNLSKYIYFTGYVSDEKMPVIYRNAELLVFPSIYEGFGLPLVEAMASKTPIISSNESSLPEVAEEAAIYFNAKNSEELKKKIELLLRDEKLKKEYIKRGSEQVKKFSWEKTTEQLIETFNYFYL